MEFEGEDKLDEAVNLYNDHQDNYMWDCKD